MVPITRILKSFYWHIIYRITVSMVTQLFSYIYKSLFFLIVVTKVVLGIRHIEEDYGLRQQPKNPVQKILNK